MNWFSDSEILLDVKKENQGLIKKIKNLENIFLTEVWSKIVSRINETNKNVRIDFGSKLFDSLADFLSEIRDEFDNYETIAREKCPDSDYKHSL